MVMRNPVHPGEVLREDVLADLGLGVGEAASRLGVSRVTLSRVSTGTRGSARTWRCAWSRPGSAPRGRGWRCRLRTTWLPSAMPVFRRFVASTMSPDADSSVPATSCAGAG